MGTVWRMVVRGALALMLVIQLEANSKDIGDTSREDKLNDKCIQKEFVAPDGMCSTNKTELDDGHVLRCKCEDPYERAEDSIHCRNKCDLRKNRDKCSAPRATCELDGRYNAVFKCPPMLTQEKEDAPCNKLALCEPNPCIHGKCVLVDKIGIAYNCSESYGGMYCNSATKVTKTPKCRKLKMMVKNLH